jgi:phage gp46-like protein
MPDIATIWDRSEARGDWARSAPDLHVILDAEGRSVLDTGSDPLLDALAAYTPGTGLLEGGDLATAVMISLFTDTVAGADDIVPDNSGDPRGWWGDVAIGSKIWLRLRAKKVPATLELVRQDITDALQWMISDGVAARIDVDVAFQGEAGIAAAVTIVRRSGAAVTLAYEWAWRGE